MNHLFVLAAVLLASIQLYAQTPTIRGARLTGSGCSNATASANVTPDGTFLSVLFDNFSIEIGNGSANPQAASAKKQCTVLIDMDVPFGYQYAIETTEFRGFAALPASAFGYHRFSQVVPGVVAFYRQLAQANAQPALSPIIYLSASPRQLHTGIASFLDQSICA